MPKSDRPQAVIVNRCFVKQRNRLLIVQRSEADAHYPLCWEAPGGKLDIGQDLMNAQQREVLEETGLLVSSVHRLVFVESYVIGAGKYTGLPYIALFHVTEPIGGRITLSKEHEDWAWVTYARMLQYNLTPEVRKAAIVLEHLLV